MRLRAALRRLPYNLEECIMEMIVIGVIIAALLALAAGGAMLPTAAAKLEFVPATGLASAAVPVAGRPLGRPATKLRRARRSHTASSACRRARATRRALQRTRAVRGQNWRTGA
jgi:hypothetical protein